MTAGTLVCRRCGRTEPVGTRCGCCPQCGGPKSASAVRCYTCAWPGRAQKATTRPADVDLSGPVSPIPRRRRIRFRVYCFSCGRATEVDVAPRRVDRCDVCGGAMLVEVADTD
jgi:rRNA maturation endonuclease Nob1